MFVPVVVSSTLDFQGSYICGRRNPTQSAGFGIIIFELYLEVIALEVVQELLGTKNL